MQSIEKLFLQAVELESDAEQKAFLKKLSAESTSAAAEVRLLLENQSNANAVFDQISVPETRAGLHGSTDQHATIRIGAQIGPYKLLEPIGEGGMGVVYLAQQSEPVRRKVALKIIKPGMDSKQVVARFEAERQALAMMEHPNIAKVLDAGTTESGLPFFAMELVRGIPFTDYCLREAMPLEQRLTLFRDACLAIQHAHNKGIIHRDIKPSNVLITEHDGTPVVKVIDFGVAKALADNLTDKTMFTGVFQMIGTPLYMSPEQASLSNLDVDTRSDVYSLGVMLYELVSGTLPIERESARELSLQELQQQICESVPPRPSKRLSTLKDEKETLADQKTRSIRLRDDTVSSELDWVTMKAIEKDRKLRYQSPRDLAEDLDRYLSGDAVEACPPSVAYRLKKFVQRNRGVAVSAALICATILLAILGIGWQAYAAQQAAEAAETEKEIAQAIAKFMTEDLFGAANPKGGRGKDLTVLEVLDEAAMKVDGAFPEQPLVEAAVRQSLGENYAALSESQSSLEQFEKSRDLYLKFKGDESREYLSASRWYLAEKDTVAPESVSLEEFDALVSVCKSALGEKDEVTLRTRANRIKLLSSRGEHDQALAGIEEIKADYSEVFGRDSRRMFQLENTRVITLYRSGEYELSVEEGKLLLARCEEVFGEVDPTTMTVMNHMLGSLQRLRRLDEARELARRQVKISEHLYGENSYNHLVSRANWIQLNSSERNFEDLLQACERFTGPNSDLSLNCLNELALHYNHLNDWDSSIPLLRDYLERLAESQKERNDEMRRVGTKNLSFALGQKAVQLALNPESTKPDRNKALTLAREAVELDPSQMNYFYLSIAECQAGEYRNAYETLGKAKPSTSNVVSAYMVLHTKSYAELDRLDIARPFFESSVAFAARSQVPGGMLQRMREIAMESIGVSEEEYWSLVESVINDSIEQKEFIRYPWGHMAVRLWQRYASNGWEVIAKEVDWLVDAYDNIDSTLSNQVTAASTVLPFLLVGNRESEFRERVSRLAERIKQTDSVRASSQMQFLRIALLDREFQDREFIENTLSRVNENRAQGTGFHADIAFAHMRLGNYEQAVAGLERAVKYLTLAYPRPALESYSFGLAQALKLDGQDELANQALEKARERKSEYPLASPDTAAMHVIIKQRVEGLFAETKQAEEDN